MNVLRSRVWRGFALAYVLALGTYAWRFHQLNGPPPDIMSGVVDVLAFVVPPLLVAGIASAIGWSFRLASRLTRRTS